MPLYPSFDNYNPMRLLQFNKILHTIASSRNALFNSSSILVIISGNVGYDESLALYEIIALYWTPRINTGTGYIWLIYTWMAICCVIIINNCSVSVDKFPAQYCNIDLMCLYHFQDQLLLWWTFAVMQHLGNLCNVFRWRLMTLSGYLNVRAMVLDYSAVSGNLR